VSNSNIDIAVKWTQTGEQIAKDSATAIEKIGATADGASPKLKGLTDQIGKAGSTSKEAGGIFHGAGIQLSTFASGFAIGSLIEKATEKILGFAEQSFEAGERLKALSAKTGIGTTALQQLQYIAAETGSTLEDLTQASFMLGSRLNEGDAAVVKGVERLGLNLEALKSQTPEEQLFTVVRALGEVQSQTERNAIGVEIFGRSFSTIAQTVGANWDKLKEHAVIVSGVYITALTKAKDSWSAWMTNAGSAVTAGMAAAWLQLKSGMTGLIDTTDLLDKSTAHTADTVKEATDFHLHYIGALTEEQYFAQMLVKAAGDQIVAAGRLGISDKDLLATLKEKGYWYATNVNVIGLARKAMEDQADATKKANDEEQKRKDAIFDLNSSLTDLSEDEQYYYLSLLQSGKGEHDIQTAYKLTGQQIRELVTWKKTLSDADDQVAKEEAAFVRAQIKLEDDSVTAAVEAADKKQQIWTDLYGDLLDMQVAHDEHIKQKQDDADKAAEEAHKRFVDAVVTEGDRLLWGLTHGWDAFKSAALGVFEDIAAAFEHQLVSRMVASFLTGTNQMGGMFAGFKSLISGGGGAAAGAAGSAGAGAAAAGSTGAGSVVPWTAGGGGGGGAAIGAGLAAALPFIALAGPGLAVLLAVKLAHDGRDVVKNFAGLFGGFDNEQKYLDMLPNGDELWAAQSNVNPRDQDAAAGIVGQIWQEFVDAGIIGSVQLSDGSVYQSIRGGPAAGQLLNRISGPTQVAGGGDPNAIIDPGTGQAPLSFAEGTGGEYVDFGAGTLAVLHRKERVMTEAEAGGAAISFGDIHIHGASGEAGGYAAARAFRDQIQAMFARGEIQVPARAVRATVGAG
jgi:hypothetical protein